MQIWPSFKGDNWEKTDWNCLLRIFAFSLFSEEVVFVLGSLRGETPCVSCLAFFIREKSFFEIDPDFFWILSSPPSLKPSIFWM